MKTLQLTKGKTALVDDEDFEWASKYKWSASWNGYGWYAVRGTTINYTNRKFYMHRQILGAKQGQIVDHIDGNGLNNRRSNLRFCTNADNGRNRGKQKNGSSGFKGITRCGSRWAAQIGGQGKHYIGLFRTKEEAARAYDCVALQRFGKFAKLNFPKGTT